jgi:hypothetical protein
MSAIIPPDDLIDLKTRFLEAEAAYRAICRSMPTGEQIVAAYRAGATAITPEQYDASEAALRRCTGLAMQIQSHPWWRTQPSRTDADLALWNAARGRVAVPAG